MLIDIVEHKDLLVGFQHWNAMEEHIHFILGIKHVHQTFD